MSKQPVTLSWSTRKRLYYLEFKLFWEGRANRGDLTRTFGISVPQASADLARYQMLAPQNISYDASGKFYFPSAQFDPKLISPTAEAYFADVTAYGHSEHLPLVDDYIGLVPTPNRIIDSSILKEIVRAVKNNLTLEIDYRSLSHPEGGNTRWVSPHAFGSDGFRWHVRGYCHSENRFKDFVLGRIASVVSSVESDIDPKSDTKWSSYFDVIIGPSSRLSTDQRNLIAMDYGMTNYRVVISCRRALLYYLLKKLNINVQDDARSGEEQQIEAINLGAVIMAMNSE